MSPNKYEPRSFIHSTKDKGALFIHAQSPLDDALCVLYSYYTLSWLK